MAVARDKGAADFPPCLVAHRNILEVRVGRGKPARRRRGERIGGVHAPGRRIDEGRQSVGIGRFEFCKLPPVENPCREFIALLGEMPDGNFLYVVNFNLHGDPVPSSVSVVDTNQMLEVARINTCVMPHGSRITHDGSRQYSACMMDDLLVEIDADKMKVARTFRLGAGKEQGFAGMAPRESAGAATSAMPAKMEGHDGMAMSMSAVTCSPTWAQPSVDGARIFVACNKSNEIVEVDTKSWALVRRIPAGNGVYNLGVSPDGKLLVATNKRDASASIFDIATGKELARIPTKRKVVHGVVISPDSLYAFVTSEGVGEEPGNMEVIDLVARKAVANVDTPPQAAGIDFWKME